MFLINVIFLSKHVYFSSPRASHHGKSRLRRQAEQAGLKLSIPKKSAESTTSEVSDHLTSATPIPTHSPRSPISPLFSLENLHDIEELMIDDENATNIDNDTGTQESLKIQVRFSKISKIHITLVCQINK